MCKASAERGFFRALKELRQLQKASGRPAAPETARQVMAQTQASMAALGSFLQDEKPAAPAPARSTPPVLEYLEPAWMPRDLAAPGRVDVPMSIGRPR